MQRKKGIVIFSSTFILLFSVTLALSLTLPNKKHDELPDVPGEPDITTTDLPIPTTEFPIEGNV
jgi:hypothetical protein